MILRYCFRVTHTSTRGDKDLRDDIFTPTSSLVPSVLAHVGLRMAWSGDACQPCLPAVRPDVQQKCRWLEGCGGGTRGSGKNGMGVGGGDTV